MHRRRASALAAVLALASLVAGGVGGAAASAPAPAALRGAPIPPNDDWANATPIGPLPATKTANSENATTEFDEPASICNSDENTVWYKMTPTTNAVILVDTVGSIIDTGVSVWTGNSVATLTEVACSYGSERTGDDQEAGKAAFRAKAGVKYYIQVNAAEDGDFGGPITLHVKVVTPPSNDQFGAAQAIPLPFHTVANNTNATTQPDEPAGVPCEDSRATLWYRVTPSQDMVIRADTLGSQPDTILAVFTGTTLANLQYRNCDDDTSEDDNFSTQSLISWRAIAGTTYWLQVAGYDNETGPIDLTVQQVSPRPNDQRGQATVITSLPFNQVFSNRNATPQSGESITCGSDTQFIQSVWYRYTAPSTAGLMATTDGEDGTNAILAVFTGSTFATEDEIGCVVQTTLNFTPEAGETYWFLVGGSDGRSGPMEFALDTQP